MFYRLSRFSALHRLFRSGTYAVLWNLPDWFKWPVLGAFLKFRLPYRLLREGDLAVQIGAPWDLLKAGRSRGIHMARAVGKSGRVVIVEPDADNVDALRAFIRRQNISNILVVPSGAWSSKTRLRFLIDRANPAANLVEDVVDASRVDLERFEVTEIEVNSIENILKENGFSAPRLVSITTNGSENEILKGMKSIAEKVQYLATIGDEHDIPMLKVLRFVKFGGDDRGWTYHHDADGG